MTDQPRIAVVMGSQSDWDTMRHSCDTLTDLKISFFSRVVSAHRTPDAMFDFAEQAKSSGLQCIIAGAGGAAHLPGMIAAKTPIVVLGVPILSEALRGQDSLLSIVQMPAGIPVATFAIGKAGAINAALFAAAMLSIKDIKLAARLTKYRNAQRDRVLDNSNPSQATKR